MNSDRKLVSELLGLAAALSWHGKLYAELAAELVERTAMTVNLFPFLDLVIVGVGIDTEKIGEDDYDKLPHRLQIALAKNKYSEAVAGEIEGLGADDFNVLVAYLNSGEVERTRVEFNIPIIRYIRAHELVPDDLLFAFMAGSLREPIGDGLGDALGGLLGLGLIGSLVDDD